MAFAGQRLLVLVFAQDVLVEFHFGLAQRFDEGLEVPRIIGHFVGDVVGVDIDSDRSDKFIAFPVDRDCRALEHAGADIAFVIELALLAHFVRLSPPRGSVEPPTRGF